MAPKIRGILDQRILDQQRANRQALEDTMARIPAGKVVLFQTVYPHNNDGYIGYNMANQHHLFGSDESGQQIEAPVKGIGLLSPALKQLTKRIAQALKDEEITQ